MPTRSLTYRVLVASPSDLAEERQAATARVGPAPRPFRLTELLVLLLAVVGLVIGVWLGRSRGLQHLGEAEFRTRWRNALGVSRWF